MRFSTPFCLAAVLAASSVLTFAVPAAAASVVEGEEHCVVNVASGDRLNMRERPSAGAPVVARKAYGQCGITVIGACRGEWCPVEDGHHQGWVNSRFIAMVSPALYCVSGVAEDDVLNLRAYPSATSRVLDELGPHECDIAFLPYSSGGWQKVRAAGHEGWVSRRFLSGE